MSLSKKIQAKRQEKIKAEKIKKAKNTAANIAAGTALGIVSGILLAPKSGKETREDIKNASKQAASVVSDKASNAKSKADDVLDSQKTKFSNSKAKIKEYLNSVKESNAEECPEDLIEVNSDNEVEDDSLNL